jgi:hypothetical protein
MSAGADDIAHLQNFRFTIAVMDHDAVEFDGRVPYADLQETIATGGLADLNVVVVIMAINVRLAKVNPVGRVRGRGDIQQECQSKKRYQDLLHVLLS